MSEENQYRKCVAILVFKTEGYGSSVRKEKNKDESNFEDDQTVFGGSLFFSAERIDPSGAWQIPQGGVEANENDFDAALRELREETGIRSVLFLKSTKNRFRYNFPEKIMEKRKRLGFIPYKGQSVKFFLFKFIGDESEINLKFSEEVEFSNWKWKKIQEIINETVDFKKEAITNGIKELFSNESFEI